MSGRQAGEHVRKPAKRPRDAVQDVVIHGARDVEQGRGRAGGIQALQPPALLHQLVQERDHVGRAVGQLAETVHHIHAVAGLF
ncbi:hypothetical protein CSC88_26330, partial [Klebsiella pneumoniae]